MIKRTKFDRRIMALGVFVFVFALMSVKASGLLSENFESPLVSSYANQAPQGWALTGTVTRAGVVDTNTAAVTGASSNQVAWCRDYNGQGAIITTSNKLDAVLEAYVHYTLSVHVAKSGSTAHEGVMELLAGTNVVATDSVIPVSSDLAESALSISFIPMSDHPNLDDKLAVRLRSGDGLWSSYVYFDDLTLDAVDTSSDVTPPTPSTMTWATPPLAVANSSISMTATNAADPNHVQYFFTNTVNGNTSGWVNEPSWLESGLTDGVTYSYKVKARDNSSNLNETDWSTIESATANADVLLYDSFEAPPHADVTASTVCDSQGWERGASGHAGLHDESAGTFVTPYGSQAAYVYDNNLTFGTTYTYTNTGAVLAQGTTYMLSFNAAAENSGNAGYGVDLLAGTNVVATTSGAPGTNDISATSVTLAFAPSPGHPNLGQTIGVRLRKPSGGWNQGHIIYDNVLLTKQETADDTIAPMPNPSTWLVAPVSDVDNSVSMIANSAIDANGVQYLFTNNVNGNTSGWQDSNYWTDTSLTPNATYSYQFRTRDNSVNLNKSAWSSEEDVTVNPYLIINESFEWPDIAGEGSAAPTGWEREHAYSSLWDESIGWLQTPYGEQVAACWIGTGFKTTNLGHALEVGVTYTLTFNVGNVDLTTGLASDASAYEAYLMAGTTVVATVSGVTSTENMSEEASLVFAPEPDHPCLGEALSVRLINAGTDYHQKTIYDNVLLVAEPTGITVGSGDGGVLTDYIAGSFEVTVGEYVSCLNAMTNGELSVNSGQVALTSSSNLLCLTTDADPTAYVEYDSEAAMGSRFSAVDDRNYHPMIFVSWFGAAVYCNWRSEIEGLQQVYAPASGWVSTLTNSGYRLPTEAEWYKSAAWNASSGRFYAYATSSDTITGNSANFANSGDLYETNAVATTPVGFYDATSPYRVSDMSGNVSEWCNDLYLGSDPDVDPHTIRGGAWGQPAGRAKAAFRFALKPGEATDAVGFRVYRTLVSE